MIYLKVIQMSDIKLYFKKIISVIIQIFGLIICLIGFVLLFESQLFWLMILMGFLIFIFGKAKNFEFERESGLRVYNR